MKHLNRRTVVLSAVAVSCSAAAGITVFQLAEKSKDKGLLRPPGALGEKEFLAACIKCGQCIQVCPYHSLKLLDLTAGIDMGTPYIDPLDRGCYLCDLFPCILCCPSGALDPKVQTIDDVQMGTARVKSEQKCWAKTGKTVTGSWLKHLEQRDYLTELEQKLNAKMKQQEGAACRLCEVVCPVPNPRTAIVIRDGVPVIGRGCVGCGACAEVCPEHIIEIKARISFASLYEGK